MKMCTPTIAKIKGSPPTPKFQNYPLGQCTIYESETPPLQGPGVPLVAPHCWTNSGGDGDGEIY
jgi:hypothetical protein